MGTGIEFEQLKTYQVGNPDAWLLKAAQLYGAAEALRRLELQIGSPEMDIRWNFPCLFLDQELMLSAMSLEAVFKCLFILRTGNARQAIKFNHDLETCATEAGVSYDEVQLKGLRQLKAFNEVYGRYPSARKEPERQDSGDPVEHVTRVQFADTRAFITARLFVPALASILLADPVNAKARRCGWYLPWHLVQ